MKKRVYKKKERKNYEEEPDINGVERPVGIYA